MNMAAITTTHFRTVRTAIVVALAALLVSACATGPRVFSNESPAADFERYRTYTFAEKLGTDDRENVRSLLSQHLIISVSQQLDRRGYQFVNKDADLIVDFAHITKEKLRSSPSTSIGGFYGYGPHPGYGYYGGYDGGSQITQYTEGTLSVAVVDAGTNSVAWEGLNIARITDAVRSNIAASVSNAIDEIFTRFPYTAASSAAELADNR